MIKRLEKLSNLPGVSGREEAVRETIMSAALELADEVDTDGAGSVIAFKKGKKKPKKKVMLAAHMDEVGLIITYIDDTGLIKFSAVGGINPEVLPGRAVLCGEKRIPGVIILPPVHLISEDEKGKSPKMDSLYIDIGARSRGEAARRLAPGDVCVFDTDFGRFGDGLLRGKALDDRAGCAVLLELMKSDLAFDTWFAFTTMEEVGLRGAGCAASVIEPDIAIVVEATTAADIPGVEGDKRVCTLHGGAVVGFMDKATIYDKELYDLALRLAEEKDIPVQIKSMIAGGNDAGAISRSGKGVRTLAVSVPCRYLHSPASVIAETDLAAVRDLIAEILKVLSAEL